MKSKQKLPLVLNDTYPHWKRLSVQGEEVDDDFSVMEECNGIQESLKKCPYKMKLYIKEMMRQLAFPEATNLSPPPKKVVTKGAPKRKRSTIKVSSTGRILSKWEVIDSQNPDSQPSQPKVTSKEERCTPWLLLPLTGFIVYFKTFLEYPIHFTNSKYRETFC
ncbi:hypothetical protein MTR_7g067030 [Medicago truncatula]|uniref:Uncharacterized protein n=1 Tax=Medicago truncatula TaxID=3880 RepID=A0A072UBC5_MEDTR|nr:hypothetical protein MTR_7g067030 [Medicago truncatula]